MLISGLRCELLLLLFFFKKKVVKIRVRIIHGRALYTGKYGRYRMLQDGLIPLDVGGEGD